MELFDTTYNEPGSSPGVLPPDEPGQEPVDVTLIDYDSVHMEERQGATLDQCLACRERDSVTWIHIAGRPNQALMRRLGEQLGFNPLALEDTMNSGQRPKVEEFEDHILVVLAHPVRIGGTLEVCQVSLFLAKGVVVSFDESDRDVFQPVRRRLRLGTGRIRKLGADYLLYALIDVVIDHQFPLLESYGDRIEGLEERLLEDASGDTLKLIHQLKRELLLLRRWILPEREVLSHLLREDTDVIDDALHPYLRDCHDHAKQIIDLIETYREMTAHMMDVYISSMNTRINDIMRVLTVISAIFLPLSFFASVYGMNFDPQSGPFAMPELAWAWSYPLWWAFCLGVAGSMLLYFRRRGWI